MSGNVSLAHFHTWRIYSRDMIFLFKPVGNHVPNLAREMKKQCISNIFLFFFKSFWKGHTKWQNEACNQQKVYTHKYIYLMQKIWFNSLIWLSNYRNKLLEYLKDIFKHIPTSLQKSNKALKIAHNFPWNNNTDSPWWVCIF